MLDLWIRGEQKASKRAYYHTNPEAYKKLITEQEDVKAKLETLESIYTRRNKEFLDNERQLRIRISNVGIFKAKERRALEEQLEAALNERTKFAKAYRTRKAELNKQLEDLGYVFPKERQKMKTAEEMNSYTNQHAYHYDNMGGNYQKFFCVIEEMLRPDEYVLMPIISNGFHCDSNILAGGNTAVVFTNQRVLIGRKKIQLAADLHKIAYVERGTIGLVDGHIYLNINGHHYMFTVSAGNQKRTYEDLLEMLESFEYGLCCWSASAFRAGGNSLVRSK